MRKRLPKPGELIMTANYVCGYEDAESVTNQLAVVKEAEEDSIRRQTVSATLLATNKTIILFENEYTYPDKEQSDEGG